MFPGAAPTAEALEEIASDPGIKRWSADLFGTARPTSAQRQRRAYVEAARSVTDDPEEASQLARGWELRDWFARQVLAGKQTVVLELPERREGHPVVVTAAAMQDPRSAFTDAGDLGITPAEALELPGGETLVMILEAMGGEVRAGVQPPAEALRQAIEAVAAEARQAEEQEEAAQVAKKRRTTSAYALALIAAAAVVVILMRRRA